MLIVIIINVGYVLSMTNYILSTMPIVIITMSIIDASYISSMTLIIIEKIHMFMNFFFKSEWILVDLFWHY